MEARPPSLKVGTGWIELETIAEPDVILTIRGYAPVLRVRQLNPALDYLLYISAKSIAEPLEELRKDNGNLFVGVRFRIRKASMDRTSKYELEALK